MPVTDPFATGESRPHGAILAGGASRRMGCPKSLVELAGRPLLQHVIDRLAPQVQALVLSVEHSDPSMDGFALPQLPDPMPGHRGPLGGLLAALRHFDDAQSWLLLAPCDAPFLPLDLADRLHACAQRVGAPAAVAVETGVWQPTFSIWQGSLLPKVERAVLEAGEGGLKRFLREAGAATCSWPDDGGAPSPFFNINDRATLEQAEHWLRPAKSGRERLPCSA